MTDLSNRQKALSAWLTGTWLSSGPVACYVGGFSGVGKTTLARAVAAEVSGFRVVEVEVPPGEQSGDEVLFQIWDQLQPEGTPLESSPQAIANALERLLHVEPVLVIIDEAQRLLSRNRTMSRPVWPVLQRLARRSRCRGRLLFVGNTAPEELTWEEHFAFRLLGPLEPAEGEHLLTALIPDGSTISRSDLRRVSVWFGGNPRALRTTAVLLRYEPLEDLVQLVPVDLDLDKDVTLAPELIAALEQQFTERTLKLLRPEMRRRLRGLAVHRTGFERTMIDMVADGDTFGMITELMSKFHVELDRKWYRVTPVARELALTELRRDPEELRAAHVAAGRYYARHFNAKQVSGRHLGQRYAEARHHLVAAGEQPLLDEITAGFTTHIVNKYSSTSQVPQDAETMAEMMAELGAVLDRPRSWGAHDFYARLLNARAGKGDAELAIQQCDYGLRLQPGYAPLWLMKVAGLQDLGRLEDAVPVVNSAIAAVPPTQNLFSLYQAGIELHIRRQDLDAAVALLNEGIKRVPPTQSLFSLYQAGIELHTRRRDLGAAVTLSLNGLTSGKIRSGYKIAESILYVLLGRVVNNDEREAALGWWTRVDAVLQDRQQVLSSILRLASDHKWTQVHAVARAWREANGTYIPLLGQEIFAALFAGDVGIALAAAGIVNLETGRSQQMAWLLSLCYDAAGMYETAWELLGTFWGIAPADGSVKPILVDIWRSENEDFGPRPSFFFPALPPFLTGGDSPAPATVEAQQHTDPSAPPPRLDPVGLSHAPPMNTATAPLHGKATILFLAANPMDSTRLAVDREYREVDAALRSSGLRDIVDLHTAFAVRVRDLQTALLRYEPTIVHFAGHGLKSKGIVLEDVATEVTGEALARLFEAIGRNVRLVVLNACWSLEQARAIVPVSGCVVGMRQRMSDTAAIEFAQSLYETLAYGRSMQEAFGAAVARLGLLGLGDGPEPGDVSGGSANPQMLLADGVDAGRLWLVGPPA